jgi:hypothetical protein
MKQFSATIPIGIGDMIYTKAFFEPIKHEYSHININFHRGIINDIGKNPNYNQFIDEFSNLLFGEMPYCLKQGSYPFYGIEQLATRHGLQPHKPELSHILCKGTPLNLDVPYIVINTKIRSLPRQYLHDRIPEFWSLLNKIVTKYKLVILGEKIIEMNGEYQYYTSENIFSLYQHILNNIPLDLIVDLTVPALGITSPTVAQVQQDCLIMNQAKFVITFGIGGGFCMSTAVANTIGFRGDDDLVADTVFSIEYPNAYITKDWDAFMNKLRILGEV